MEHKLGNPKNLDSITKEDVLKNKVWIWTWEAGLEGDYPEDWQVPVLNTSVIGKEIFEPIITLEIENSDLIASASLDLKKKCVFGISIWDKNKWKMVSECQLDEPIRFIPMIKIRGIENPKFELLKKEDDIAKLVEKGKSWKFWK